MNRTGNLYVIEGPDGVGKTTLAHLLTQHIHNIGRPCQYHSFPGKENGTLGAYIYDFHHQANIDNVLVSATSLQLLHIAAHIDAIDNTIRPALECGINIVLDRFWWSTWVYGMVHGANQKSLDAMIKIEQEHWGNILPKVTFLICRDTPFDEVGTSTWCRIKGAYDESVLRPDWAIGVQKIRNEDSIENALAKLVQHL